jgi:pyruvate dehydrogenase E2 component (dihydrolipoamide acetyltransferase)
VAGAVEVRVPNIGDFKDVPVIEVLVKPGDKVEKEAPLITLESEKASIEVPSPSAGVVENLAVKVGDKVSEGSPILTLAGDGGAQTQAAPAPNGQAKAAAPSAPQPAPQAPLVDVTVPDIGDFSDVPVIEVLVKPGDAVQKESPLVTLESEKASMEVPSPEAGVVKSVDVKVGDKVSKGMKILTLASSVPAAAQPAPSVLVPPTAPSTAQPAASPTPAAPPSAPSGAAVHASPSIRRFARELGVDLATVTASGPNGRVTRDDVQSFVKRALSEPRSAAGALPFGLPPWPKVDFAQYGAIERQPLSRIKKISGPVLARNWIMIPHVTNQEDADITDLEKFRQELNAESPTIKITMLAFLIKAVIPALQHYPEVNASLDGENLILKKYYHIGFAADTPNGLLVPVVKDADKKGLLAIAAETRELAARARDGKLGLAEMQGASFTISSLGGIGGTGFTPIINAPEVAILGVSRSSMRPFWDGKKFVPRLILPLSLSYDHRVIDGAQAARFNALLANVLADMRRAML